MGEHSLGERGGGGDGGFPSCFQSQPSIQHLIDMCTGRKTSAPVIGRGTHNENGNRWVSACTCRRTEADGCLPDVDVGTSCVHTQAWLTSSGVSPALLCRLIPANWEATLPCGVCTRRAQATCTGALVLHS